MVFASTGAEKNIFNIFPYVNSSMRGDVYPMEIHFYGIFVFAKFDLLLNTRFIIVFDGE